MYMPNHIILRNFRCEVLPRVAGKQLPQEMLMRFPFSRSLAVPGKQPVSKATIAVEQGSIKEIRDGYVDAAALGLPADTPVIDLTDKFVNFGGAK
jgi:hypothetical protein